MTNFKPRKTVYKGIEMRSRLEAGFAQWLDARGIEWEYEPSAFGAEVGQYLPDFLVHDLSLGGVEHQATYIEVKPAQPDPGELRYQLAAPGYPGHIDSPKLNALARQMEVVWESEPAAGLVLIWPDLRVENGYLPGALELVRLEGEEDRNSLFRERAWVKTRTVGLATPILPGQVPWPDGYWQVD